jgi:hypothetical protein
MFRATEPREFAFQFRHLGAKDELAVRQDRVEPAPQIVPDPRLLSRQVEKRNGRFCHGHGL